MSHEGEVPEAVETLDRRELLSAQFEEAEAQDREIKEHKADPSAPVRTRDETGKFLPKEKVASPAPAVQGQQVQGSAPAPAAALEPWATAPKSWKPHVRDGWAKVDPQLQQYIHEREQEMRAGVEPLLPKAELADKINKAAEPYINTIRGLGIDLPTAISGLMQTDHNLRNLPYEGKLQLLHQLARNYGVDLSGQMPVAQQMTNPQLQQMQNELLAMKGQFTNFTQTQEAAQQRAAVDEIQRFAATAEHFEEVRPVMAQLIQSGMAEGIPDAYDKAIRLNPTLFDQIASSRHVAAEADKRKAADAAAKAAKAAAVSVRSATPGVRTTTKAQDRRSVLLEQFDSLSERL